MQRMEQKRTSQLRKLFEDFCCLGVLSTNFKRARGMHLCGHSLMRSDQPLFEFTHNAQFVFGSIWFPHFYTTLQFHCHISIKSVFNFRKFRSFFFAFNQNSMDSSNAPKLAELNTTYECSVLQKVL